MFKHSFRSLIINLLIMQIKRLLSCLGSSLRKKHDILKLLTFQSHKMYCMGALENMYRLELTYRALNKKNHPYEVVDRGSETQLRVVNFQLNTITQVFLIFDQTFLIKIIRNNSDLTC